MRAQTGAILALALALAGAASAWDAGPAAAARAACFGAPATIVGTARAERITGTRRPDVIVGLGGADVIRGLGGNDRICGGPGNDRLDGGRGQDRLDGGAGVNVCGRGEHFTRCRLPDTRRPELVSARVVGADVTLTYDEPLRRKALDRLAFIAAINGTVTVVEQAFASGSTARLRLRIAVNSDDVVSLSYTPAGRGAIHDVTDTAGNPASALALPALANGSPTGCSPRLRGRGAEATGTAQHLPVAGVLRAVMLFVDFPDSAATAGTDVLYRRLVPDAAAWYAAASYGRLTLDVTPVPRWLRMPRPASEYGTQVGRTADQWFALLRDAVAVADATVDFRAYEVVYIVGWMPHAHRGSFAFDGPSSLTADGRPIDHASFLAGDDANAGTLVHETGHLFHLPDLYSYETTSNFAVGMWDPMSESDYPLADFLAWHKWRIGWLEPSQIRCVHAGSTLEETLTPIAAAGGTKAIVIPGETSLYVVEARRPVGNDARVCDSGVLVYTVDGTVAGGAFPIRVVPAPGFAFVCGEPRLFDVGPGETATFADAKVELEVVRREESGYGVRVTAKPTSR